MEQISEDAIKKAVLSFLRSYYKFRLRYDDRPVRIQSDMKGADGIIADGYYSYIKADGKPFTATFEASSKASKEEVVFKPQKQILLWDGIAVAASLVLFLSALNLLYHFHNLTEARLGIRAAMLVAAFCIFLLLFLWLAKGFRRYRYIYAIEQFKKYHADEQWIAIGSDVFGNGDERYLEELKNQCVYNGVGLLTVDETLNPLIVIAPSRRDVFLGKRQSASFLPQKEMTQNKLEKQFGSIWKHLGRRAPSFSQGEKLVLRYQKSYYLQMLSLVFCLGAVWLIISHELKNREVAAISKEKFTEELARSQSDRFRTTEAFLIDSSANNAGKERLSDEKFWDLEAPPLEVSPQNPQTEEASKNQADLPTGQDIEGYFFYDCSRFYNFGGKKFIILEGVYDSWELTREKLEQLRKSGLESMAVLHSCFSKTGRGYLVQLGLFYNTEPEATKKLETLRKKRQLSSTDTKNWKVQAVEPVTK